jgi:hypothetical protein
VVRVCEDAAVGEDDVLANLGDFSVDLHLLADLHHVEELARQRDGNGAHVRHPQHPNRCDHVNHRRKSTPVDRLLDVLLVALELIPEASQLGIVLVAINCHQTTPKVLPEPPN